MSLDLSIAGVSLTTAPDSLKAFREDINLVFHLDHRLSAFLDTPLSQVPTDALKTTIAYASPATSWNPGAGPVQFGLQGGASATLEVVNTGDLLTYAGNLDATTPTAVPLPPGTAYVKLTLSFNLSANAAFAWSGGNYGAKASLDTARTYAVTFARPFPPSTPLTTAITETFQAYVLPLHPETLSQLDRGDFLHYEFDGNLHLSFGAYIGIDQALYAGQSTADVLRGIKCSLATLASPPKPVIKAGASLDFTIAYATRFEALLSKSAASADLHLFRSATMSQTATLKAGLSLDLEKPPLTAPKAEIIKAGLAAAAGTADPQAAPAVKTILPPAQAQIDHYLAEVNDKLTALVNKDDGLKTNLEAAIERSHTRTLLAGYTFDLASPVCAEAWRVAVAGDLTAALQIGAITLDPGSGLEHAYQIKTSFNVNFFNLWSMKSWSEFNSTRSLVYAGNNVFHFVAEIGRTSHTEFIGAMRNMNFYFNATANQTPGSDLLGPVDLTLHLDLTSTGDVKAANRIASLLHLAGGEAANELAQNLRAFAGTAKNGTVELHLAFPRAAFARVDCETYTNGKPATASTAKDQKNWEAFARSANDLDAWELPRFTPGGDLPYLCSFAGWQALNLKMNDHVNRASTAYPIGTWPDNFPDLDAGTRLLILYSLTAGQTFMNFCGDLKDLVQATSTDAVPRPWEDLVKQLTSAIKNDTKVDFTRVAALSLVRLCSSGAVTLSGPTAPALPVTHFAVSMSL